MSVAIEASGLVKDFEKGRRTIWERLRREPDQRETFRAVDGVDLHVGEGEVFGILGPNGAGKTTTMRMLATLLEPTSGKATVIGHDLVTESREIRRRLGAVLSGERSLYWKLTARENLEYFAALYHVPARETRSRIIELLEVVHLTDRADDYVEKFSTGMRQRLVLARALLPDPTLLLLDEPTVGLDPQASRDLRERVLKLRDDGRTVLLTTHYMEEAEQLCDRIGIMDHGKVLELGRVPELVSRRFQERTVRFPTIEGLADAELAGFAGVSRVAREDGETVLHTRDVPGTIGALLAAGERLGSEPSDLAVRRPTLEDVFLALTGRALRD